MSTVRAGAATGAEKAERVALITPVVITSARTISASTPRNVTGDPQKRCDPARKRSRSKRCQNASANVAQQARAIANRFSAVSCPDSARKWHQWKNLLFCSERHGSRFARGTSQLAVQTIARHRQSVARKRFWNHITPLLTQRYTDSAWRHFNAGA